MNDLMEIIKNRRSIRKYDSREVPEALVDQVLEALRWAPSWTNGQCWEVVVIREASVKQALQATFPARGNPAVKAVVQAPVLLALCARTHVSGYYHGEAATKFGEWMMYDLGLATQNLCLMAHHLGLGTVIAGLFDHDRAGAVLDVPAGYEVVTLIPLGYPARAGGAPQRRDRASFVHYEHF